MSKRSKCSKNENIELANSKATVRAAVNESAVINRTQAPVTGSVTKISSKADILAELLGNLKEPSSDSPSISSASSGNLNHASTTKSFLSRLQEELGPLDKINEDIPGFPTAIFDNLKKLLQPQQITDIVSSDEDEEYIEYVYNPRKYFLISICHFCKDALISLETIFPCEKCQMIYYCSTDHKQQDRLNHKDLCSAIRQVGANSGGLIYKNCGMFSAEDFRSYRLIAVRKLEEVLHRILKPFEKEMVLFPRMCYNPNCREIKFEKLKDCPKCFQVSYCRENPKHLQKPHLVWCKFYKTFHEIIEFQEKFGKIDPTLPTKVLKDLPSACITMQSVLKKLSCFFENDLEYATMSQIATGPLTAWYALKLNNKVRQPQLTIHLIGAELEFEVDVLQKWELFFMHLTPSLKRLNVVFVGPELNPSGIALDTLSKTKTCRICRKTEREINYSFHNFMYHDYCNKPVYSKPDLICFFNPGLHRITGYLNRDTWPETIEAAAKIKCPVVVTSYTEYECPLDLIRFIQEAQRIINVILPPVENPFSSVKPDRNFISDDEAPLIFKNYYCFVIE